MGPESGQTEIACQSSQGGIITSGGGFSEKVLQPSYQSDAIDQYLSQVQSLIEPGYHTGGRAYPDIVSFVSYESLNYFDIFSIY